MNKPIILIDMDGVIVDYISNLISVVKEGFHDGLDPKLLEISYNDVTIQNIEDLFDYCEKTKKHIKDNLHIPGMFENPRPIPGAIEAVKILAEHFEVFLCSSPFSGRVDSDHGWSEKVSWIRKHFGKEWIDKLILTRDKTVVHGEILIDDKPKITGKKNVPDWQHVLFLQPWNKEKCFSDGAHYISNWDNPEKIVNQIKEIIEEKSKNSLK
jgi:5'-nucleotidase